MRDSSFPTDIYVRRGMIQALLLIIMTGLMSGAQTPSAVDSAEAAKWREDLRFLAQEMPKQHGNVFHAVTREQFDAAVSRLDQRIPTLARHQIIVEIARIVAMVGRDRDAHTLLPLSPPRHPGAPFKVGFRQYPIIIHQYRDGFFVRAAAPEHSGIVGARVVGVGQVSVEDAFKAAGEIVTRDNDQTLKDRVPSLLTIPEVLNALGLIEDMEKARFTLELKGTRSVLELTPIPAGREVNWIDARESAAIRPLWLKDPHNEYWFEYLADSRTVYFQYNAVVNKKDGESLKDFFKKLFEFIETQPVDRLVIDMRANRGGNGVLSWPLIYGIIRSDKINKKGKLFTLIGRQTFSAGSQTAVWLGLHTEATFVGEPTGGGVNVYGDHAPITLPNSGINVWVAPNFYQNSYPWDKRSFVSPDIKAEFSFDDYRRNVDPAMNAISDYR